LLGPQPHRHADKTLGAGRGSAADLGAVQAHHAQRALGQLGCRRTGLPERVRLGPAGESVGGSGAGVDLRHACEGVDRAGCVAFPEGVGLWRLRVELADVATVGFAPGADARDVALPARASRALLRAGLAGLAVALAAAAATSAAV